MKINSFVFNVLQCTCGGGVQTRTASCVDTRENKVDERYCKRAEKMTERQCNTQECPRWVTHEWTGVGTFYFIKKQHFF